MSRGSARGFSLIEVMMVITLLGGLLALGIGQYSRMQANADLSNSAQELTGALGLARQEAMALGVALVVGGGGGAGLNPGPGRYGWEVRRRARPRLGEPIAEAVLAGGRVANHRLVTVRAEGVERHGLDEGVALVLFAVGPAGERGGDVLVIPFHPDGSPAVRRQGGLGQVGSFSLTLANERAGHRILVSALGSVQGPEAVAPAP